MNSNLLKLASGTEIGQSNKTTASFITWVYGTLSLGSVAIGGEGILPKHAVVNIAIRAIPHYFPTH